jgi:hypothetical protein
MASLTVPNDSIVEASVLPPPPTLLMTPADTVIVVPSGLTAPNAPVVASGRSPGWMSAHAGAALMDWMANFVVLVELTANACTAPVPLP